MAANGFRRVLAPHKLCTVNTDYPRNWVALRMTNPVDNKRNQQSIMHKCAQTNLF